MGIFHVFQIVQMVLNRAEHHIWMINPIICQPNKDKILLFNFWKISSFISPSYGRLIINVSCKLLTSILKFTKAPVQAVKIITIKHFEICLSIKKYRKVALLIFLTEFSQSFIKTYLRGKHVQTFFMLIYNVWKKCRKTFLIKSIEPKSFEHIKNEVNKIK